MKLRLTKNSIRIRVRKSELSILSEKELIEESISFPTKTTFNFGLKTSVDSLNVSASMANNNLKVFIPKQIANNWIKSNEVGIETYTDLEGEDQLHILIEKDFPCKDRPEEDKSDTFTELANEQSPRC